MTAPPAHAAPGAAPAGAGELDGAALGVPSPCVDVCRLAPDGVHCEGCLRTLAEIGAWRGLEDAGKRAVWARLAERRAARVAAP